MRLRWVSPWTTATTPGKSSISARTALRRALVGHHDHRAAAGGGEPLTQPGQLRGEDLGGLAADAAGRIEGDEPHALADVGGVVRPVGAARGGAVGERADHRVRRLGRALCVGGDGDGPAALRGTEQRVDGLRRVVGVWQSRAGVERRDEAVARRDLVGPRAGRELALEEDVVVARHAEPRAADAGGADAELRPGEQPHVARRVDVGAVEERVGVVGGLDALVAGAARVGPQAAAAQQPQRPAELVALRVVGHVAGDQRGVGVLPADGADGRRGDLGAERLLRPERRVKRLPVAVEERHARRRLLVADVQVGELGEGHERLPGLGLRCEVRAIEERLAPAPVEHAVAVRIDERGLCGRPRGGGRPRSRRSRTRIRRGRARPRPRRSRIVTDLKARLCRSSSTSAPLGPSRTCAA